MLRLPPLLQALIGAALLVAGVVVHGVILDIAGGVLIVVGGARLLQRRGPRGVGR